MAPIPCNAINWEDYRPAPNTKDSFESSEGLHYEDIFTHGQRQGPTEEILEFTQFCEDPNFESQRFFPDVYGIKHGDEMGPRALYYECEVRRSEVTRRLIAGGEEEISVTHTVERTWRWKEPLEECACCSRNSETAPFPFDTTGTTCGFLQHQQVPRQHTVSGAMGHCPGYRPVGDFSNMDAGEYGVSNVRNISEDSCDTCVEGRIDAQRPPSELLDSDDLLFNSIMESINEQKCDSEDDCVSISGQNNSDTMFMSCIK